MEKIRNYSLDLIKFIAILSVVFLHCIVSVYYRVPAYSFESNTFLTLDALLRYCVPLFVMSTGALLLNEDKPFSTKKFYLTRVLPTSIVFLIWLIIYSIFYMLLNNQSFLDYFITFKGAESWHLWYLYMLIALYLITPVLRLFVKKSNSKYVLLVIVLGLLFAYLLNFLQYYIPDLSVPIDKLNFGFVGGYIPYYLAGWYVANVGFSKKHKIILFVAGAVAWIIVLIACLINIDLWGIYCNEKGIFAFLFSVALFTLLYKENSTNNCNRLILFVGKRTFGIYILHVLFIDLFVFVLVPFSKFEINPFLYLLLDFLFTFSCSFLSNLFLEKIPFLRKLVMK